ncbi:S-adenosyl-L-methionine-dependent methyltransferase [Xylariaceae sp. FL1272]|nr:S-adenosyl-L-methionine-dependent methyltransferase [Xylariaceae sp. FL1272]
MSSPGQTDSKADEPASAGGEHKVDWSALPDDIFSIIGPGGGRVTAVDVNQIVLKRGRTLLTTEYGLAEDESEWVTFKTVLAYNKGQSQILGEMLRVTKPGGTESFWPPLPGLLNSITKMRAMRARGASTQSGRRLLSWALEANGGDRAKIATSFTAWSYTEAAERRLWATGMITGALAQPHIIEQNLKSGITEAEMDEMRNAWIEWRDRDDATLSMMQGQILMTK